MQMGLYSDLPILGLHQTQTFIAILLVLETLSCLLMDISLLLSLLCLQVNAPIRILDQVTG